MTSEGYRKVLWCLDQAVDLATGPSAEEGNTSMRYEWGHLEREGYLAPPWWLARLERWLGGAAALGGVLRRVQRAYCAERFEIVMAVIRAHEETARAEVSEMAAEGLMEICKESQSVQMLAEEMLVAMEESHPEVACSVRTRQACCQILQEFKGEVDGLHHIAQITAAEHERLTAIVDRKAERLTHTYPTVHVKHRPPDSLPLLRLIPADKFEPLWAALAIAPQTVPPGHCIVSRGAQADGIYIVCKVGRAQCRPARPCAAVAPALRARDRAWPRVRRASCVGARTAPRTPRARARRARGRTSRRRRCDRSALACPQGGSRGCAPAVEACEAAVRRGRRRAAWSALPRSAGAAAAATTP